LSNFGPDNARAADHIRVENFVRKAALATNDAKQVFASGKSLWKNKRQA